MGSSKSSKRKQSALGDGTSGTSSDKRWKSSGPPGALVLVGLRQSLDVFNDSFNHSMSTNARTGSRKYEGEAAGTKIWDDAVALVQKREPYLTNDQLIVLMDLFLNSTPILTTYLGIEKDDLRKAWLGNQLAQAGHSL